MPNPSTSIPDEPTPVERATAADVSDRVDCLLKSHYDLCDAARELMVRKNHDYRGGSGDPFANFRGSTAFDISPAVGLMLRMQDKLMRIKTFEQKGELHVQGEGIRDAVLDLINYSVLLYGLCANETP